MTLQYTDIFRGDKVHKVKARIAYDHSSCSYGQPAIVLPDGGALDLTSWVGLGYKVVKATEKERAALRKMGLI